MQLLPAPEIDVDRHLENLADVNVEGNRVWMKVLVPKTREMLR